MHIKPPLNRGRIAKFCVWGKVPDVIAYVKFDVDRFRGFRSLGGLKICVFY